MSCDEIDNCIHEFEGTFNKVASPFVKNTHTDNSSYTVNYESTQPWFEIVTFVT